jgi:hypothetical protein
MAIYLAITEGIKEYLEEHKYKVKIHKDIDDFCVIRLSTKSNNTRNINHNICISKGDINIFSNHPNKLLIAHIPLIDPKCFEKLLSFIKEQR